MILIRISHLLLLASGSIHDHTIDFEGYNYDIASTLRKTVTLIQHPRHRFSILEHLPSDDWTTILAHFNL